MRDIERNVGVKTVPRYSAVFLAPAPRPLPPARVPSPIPTPSEEKRSNVKLILLGILGVGVLYYLIRR